MPFFILETPTRTSNGTRDNDNKVTYAATRRFTLDASDASLTQLDARAALAVTFGVFEGVGYPGNPTYICKSVNISQVGPISYDAEAGYETIPFNPDENPDGEPELETPKIFYSSVQSELETDVDASGNPIQTATGELYQGMTRTVSDAQITIKRKYNSFSPYAFYAYENKVNADVFMSSFPAGVIRVMKIEPTPIIEATRSYWDVSIVLQARLPLAAGVTYERAWWTRVRHEGFYCFEEIPQGTDPETYKTKKVKARDANGELVSQPVPLSVTGHRLFKPETNPPEIDDTQPPNYLFFEHYPPINFSLMNLGV